MKPGPSFIAKKLLESFDLDACPRDIVEVITDFIGTEHLFTIGEGAREKAESWRGRTLDYLRLQINELIDIGRPPRISFNSSSDYMIQGACFIEPSDSDDLKQMKLCRLESAGCHHTIVSLSPDEFELLGSKLISLIGVIDPKVTRSSADDGIDFYGRLAFGSIFLKTGLSPTIQNQLSIWIVGQAKHYLKVQIGTPVIRELVGAIVLGRANALGNVKSAFSDLRIRIIDPVFGILITSGSISANAWRLLRESGIIGMDGEMIAAFLADNSIGIIDSSFNEAEFRSWLER